MFNFIFNYPNSFDIVTANNIEEARDIYVSKDSKRKRLFPLTFENTQNGETEGIFNFKRIKKWRDSQPLIEFAFSLSSSEEVKLVKAINIREACNITSVEFPSDNVFFDYFLNPVTGAKEEISILSF